MKLNFKTYGAGDPIIILHGLFGMLDNWQTIAKRLADEYMVILVDQRDHGKSPHSDAFTYPLLAEDLYQMMDDNWIYSANIIGHSMGGKTAMQFAALYPDSVEKLVVVDIAPKAYKPGHDIIFKALMAVPIDTITSRDEAEKAISKYIDDAGVRLFLMKNLQRKKEGGFRWKMNLELLHKEYKNIISSLAIDAPVETDTLFVYGTKSKYIQEEDIPTVKEHFPNATFEAMDSGHWIHAEKPNELEKILRTFLKD